MTRRSLDKPPTLGKELRSRPWSDSYTRNLLVLQLWSVPLRYLATMAPVFAAHAVNRHLMQMLFFNIHIFAADLESQDKSEVKKSSSALQKYIRLSTYPFAGVEIALAGGFSLNKYGNEIVSDNSVLVAIALARTYDAGIVILASILGYLPRRALNIKHW